LIDLLSLGVNTILRFKKIEDPQLSFW